MAVEYNRFNLQQIAWFLDGRTSTCLNLNLYIIIVKHDYTFDFYNTIEKHYCRVSQMYQTCPLHIQGQCRQQSLLSQSDDLELLKHTTAERSSEKFSLHLSQYKVLL